MYAPLGKLSTFSYFRILYGISHVLITTLRQNYHLPLFFFPSICVFFAEMTSEWIICRTNSLSWRKFKTEKKVEKIFCYSKNQYIGLIPIPRWSQKFNSIFILLAWPDGKRQYRVPYLYMLRRDIWIIAIKLSNEKGHCPWPFCGWETSHTKCNIFTCGCKFESHHNMKYTYSKSA